MLFSFRITKDLLPYVNTYLGQHPENTLARLCRDSLRRYFGIDASPSPSQPVPTKAVTKKSKVPSHDARTNKSSFNFEEIYSQYPKKLGKKQGQATFVKDVKNSEDFASLTMAVANYRNHCAKNRVEAQYIKHFSTFMNEWRDWVDPGHGATESFGGAKNRPSGSFQRNINADDEFKKLIGE